MDEQTTISPIIFFGKLVAYHVEEVGLTPEGAALAIGGMFIGIQLALRHPEYAAALLLEEPKGRPPSAEMADDLVRDLPSNEYRSGPNDRRP